MPSYDQQVELLNNCDHELRTVNGVKGMLFTGTNGGSIFLPAAGFRYGSGLIRVGSDGGYWSSTQCPSYSGSAYSLYIDSYLTPDYTLMDYNERSDGFSVRPVVRN